MPKNVHEAAIAYRQYLREQGKSERTLYTYGKDLQQVESFFGCDRDLSTIKPMHVANFLKSKVMHYSKNGAKRADETVKKTKRVFRDFLVWATNEKLFDKLPMPKGTKMGRSVLRER